MLVIGFLGAIVVSETRADRVPEPTFEIAESRLRAIYDRNEFRAKPFRADWLPDSTGYPHRDHGLREGRGTAVHLRMLMTRYLLEHLPPGPR